MTQFVVHIIRIYRYLMLEMKYFEINRRRDIDIWRDWDKIAHLILMECLKFKTLYSWILTPCWTFLLTYLFKRISSVIYRDRWHLVNHSGLQLHFYVNWNRRNIIFITMTWNKMLIYLRTNLIWLRLNYMYRNINNKHQTEHRVKCSIQDTITL